MKKTITPLMTLLLVLALTACSGKAVSTAEVVNDAQNSNTSGVAETSTALASGASTVADALAENSQVHENAEDYVWESSEVIPIVLNGDSISVDGGGVTVEGSTATITSAGTYRLSGALTDGQIIVDTKDKEVVRLILNGVDLRSSTSAPINIVDAEEAVIVLADGTENLVTDSASYVFATPEESEPNAAIFSKSDLTIGGNGSLIVNGNYNDGIASKDGLIITSGTITVNAVDDGIRGKDYLVVKGGNLTVNAQGNGLKSDNEEDATKGYISIEDGVIQVTSAGDAIQATTDVMITDGEITISAGGGSSNRKDESTSTKGIKGVVSVNIDGGTFTIDTADDGVHSNGSITVNGGTFTISTGDDGMHADSTLAISGGDIRITKSYEGIESAVITINAGTIHIIASDDGLNVASGNDGSGTNQAMGPGGMRRGGGPGQDAFTYTGNNYLYIHGGYIAVEAAGDGADINGSIEMTGGVLLMNGPTQQMNGALDYDGTFNMTGGFLVAAGSVGMAMAPSQSSSQYSILVNLNSTLQAGTLFHIQNSEGEDILTYSPTKQYQSVTFSSPELTKGSTYVIFTGGSSSGTANDSLYEGGTYTPGTQYTSIKISSIVTALGGGGGNFPQRP